MGIAEQELGNQVARSLDLTRAKLPAEFSHSFVGGELPPEYFNQYTSNSSQLAPRPDGLFSSVITRGAGSGTSRPILPRFTIHGDFDIELEFEQLELTSDTYAAIVLRTMPAAGPAKAQLQTSELGRTALPSFSEECGSSR